MRVLFFACAVFFSLSVSGGERCIAIDGDTLVCDPASGELTRPAEIGSRQEFREAPPAPQLLHVVPTEKLAPGPTPDAQRVMAAVMQMRKFDLAALKRAAKA